MVCTSFALWIILVITGLNIAAFYFYSLYGQGPFGEETLKYSVILIVGSYACLVLDRNKIYEALKVKRVELLGALMGGNCIESSAQEFEIAHTGYFDGVLKCEKKPFLCTHVRQCIRDILTI